MDAIGTFLVFVITKILCIRIKNNYVTAFMSTSKISNSCETYFNFILFVVCQIHKSKNVKYNKQLNKIIIICLHNFL